MIHCMSSSPARARSWSARGNAAQLMAKEGAYAQVRLPSGKSA
jgi:ribosomal protein L2